MIERCKQAVTFYEKLIKSVLRSYKIHYFESLTDADVNKELDCSLNESSPLFIMVKKWAAECSRCPAATLSKP